MLRDKAGRHSIRERSLPAIGRLNAAWRAGRIDEARAVAGPGAAGGAPVRLQAGDLPLVEALPGDDPAHSPAAIAAAWAQALRETAAAPGTGAAP